MILNKYPSTHVVPTFLNETEKDQSIKLYYTTIAEHQSSSTKQIFKISRILRRKKILENIP